ncbi:cytochrome c [Magnetovibrio sp.]|uniref:c-type cytochrome n=1 Tax=Magnetovibrio sp. TaxID=2024836 RepID=UPI002F93823C
MKTWGLKPWTPRSALKRAVFAVPLVCVGSLSAASVASDISTARQAELMYVLEQDCGSCHGLTLKGGLGPALLPDRLSDRHVDDLAAIILDGVPGTPMPPWRPLLEPQEATWLAHVLKSGARVK